MVRHDVSERMMKNLLTVILVVVLASSCKVSQYNHKPGGPYYFKWGVTYQGYRPHGEVTKSEADALAKEGLAYCVAHFDKSGQPTHIVKIYKGGVHSSTQLEYENGTLTRVTNTDSDGNSKTHNCAKE